MSFALIVVEQMELSRAPGLEPGLGAGVTLVWAQVRSDPVTPDTVPMLQAPARSDPHDPGHWPVPVLWAYVRSDAVTPVTVPMLGAAATDLSSAMAVME